MYELDLSFYILIGALTLLFGTAVLFITHAIISRTTNRILRGVILFLIALFGYLLFMDWGISSLATGLLVFAIPMTVILPLIHPSMSLILKNRFRIIACYIIIFLFVVVSSIFIFPHIYLHVTPMDSRVEVELTNAGIYFGWTVLTIVLATLIYRLMDAYDAKSVPKEE